MSGFLLRNSELRRSDGKGTDSYRETDALGAAGVTHHASHPSEAPSKFVGKI
ncbi:hypothetical protein GCM10009672_26320 [Nesterenkonia lutea]